VPDQIRQLPETTSRAGRCKAEQGGCSGAMWVLASQNCARFVTE
jgi:hypothetical protein